MWQEGKMHRDRSSKEGAVDSPVHSVDKNLLCPEDMTLASRTFLGGPLRARAPGDQWSVDHSLRLKERRTGK